jgi:ABC-type uncharacterized transport system involved in gliding motility auxiliary subunit
MSGVVRRRALAVVAAVVVVVAGTAVLDRVRTEVDLTADRSLSLTRTSLDVVAAVDGEVRVTAFLPRQEHGRAEAAALLDRYRRANRRISYRVLDPADSPGELRRLGVDPALGGLALEQGDRIETAPTASKQDVTAGLARLQRDGQATVCFGDQHGERPLTAQAEGVSALAQLLTSNGYRVTTTSAAALTECTAVVLAAPTADVGAGDPIVDWMQRGGRALVLTDPESTASLRPLLEPYGIRIERGVVLETNPSGHVPGDPATPVVAAYRSGFPFVRRLPPTIYPGAQALAIDPSPAEGVAVAAVAATTSGGRLDRSDGGERLEGRLTLVAAADASRVDATNDNVVRSRIVVTSDVDLLSNAFLSELGHSRLAIQALDWLTLEDDLVSVSANLARPRPLVLTDARIGYVRVLMAGVVPGMFLLAGLAVWAARRGR